MNRITSQYLHELQLVFHRIENRGICYNQAQGAAAAAQLKLEIQRNLDICSKQWGVHVYIGADNKLPKADTRASYNINSSAGDASLLRCLQTVGYKVPKITRKSEDGEYEQVYSTGELAIQKMLQSPEIALAGGDPALRAILEIREISTLLNRYFNCKFYTDPSGQVLFLTNYNVVGTLTGRRGSRKHVFQYGNNAQNIPKHGKLAKLYRSCLEARPGNIFVAVDQVSAEEWPVNALANNTEALEELRSGVDRHTKLASGLFQIPVESRTKDEWKKSMERYLGKKTRHARNYGMKGQTMSDSLAREGQFITPQQCQNILDIAAKLDPSIDKVFHAYVQACISRDRTLRTPFGRERNFLAFRPNSSNTREFNEAYAWIPQSVVGDNNGFAVMHMERDCALPLNERFLVHENHDSIMFDVPNNYNNVLRLVQELESAYARDIYFASTGITIRIPVEAEIGFNMKDMIALESMDAAGLSEAYEKLYKNKDKLCGDCPKAG